MEQELEVVNMRLVKEPSLYSEKELKCPEAVVELMAAELAQYDWEVMCILNLKTNIRAQKQWNPIIMLVSQRLRI